MPQGPELLIILLVVLLIFGGAKIPQLARSLGQAQREFRRGSEESKDEPAHKDRDRDEGPSRTDSSPR